MVTQASPQAEESVGARKPVSSPAAGGGTRAKVAKKEFDHRGFSETVGDITVDQPRMQTRDVNVYYGDKQAIKDVSLDIGRNEVVAMIGPSGCGKSTYLRCLNRINDTIEGCRVTGTITLDGLDIYDPALDVVQLRARVGMVFQKPNPFPKSIYDNVAYGPRIHGLVNSRAETDEIVQKSLPRAGRWPEVKDRLSSTGTSLSGGQQRLCIARAIAVSPEVVLMDERAGSQPSHNLLRDTHSMSRLAKKMLRDALESVARLDVELALEVAKGDAELDSEFQSALRRLATYIMEDSRNVGHAIDVTFIVRSLERTGDHWKNIAEYVIFLVKGKDVRHVSPDCLNQDLLEQA